MNNYIKMKYIDEEKYVYLTDENVTVDSIITVEKIENMNIRQMEKILNRIKRKLSSYIIQDNKKIIAYILCNDISNQKNIDMANAINALLIKNKLNRYNFLYDEVCSFLDEDAIKHNYCDFKDDICIGKRNNSNIRTMGCCHHFSKRAMLGKLIVCEHLINKSCSVKCISCKLFMCDAVKVKYKIKDLILLDYFFNVFQKIIIKGYCFKTKEEIMKKLMLLGI